MLLNCGVGEDSWESFGLQGEPAVHLKGNQSWMFIGRTDAETEIPILWPADVKNWKRPWCWERLKAEGGGEDRGWDGWMASRTQRTWVWASSGSWRWRGRPGVLQFMESQRVGQDWAMELNGAEQLDRRNVSTRVLMDWLCWIYLVPGPRALLQVSINPQGHHLPSQCLWLFRMIKNHSGMVWGRPSRTQKKYIRFIIANPETGWLMGVDSIYSQG